MSIKPNTNLYAVILAGGSGTRFWPASRRSNPKQFLNITGKTTLLQETLRRMKPQVRGSHMFIVTNAAYRKAIEQQIGRFHIPKANILLEPSGKNTAPAICWAAAKIHQMNPKAVMAVLPSDHLILNQQKYLKVLGEAVQLAQDNYLVTLGIAPTRPETGYGYLKTVRQNVNNTSILRVQQFTEKPSLPKAKQFIKNKNYFWNSGMFVWKTSVILEEFKIHLPRIYRLIGTQTKTDYIKRVWGQLPSISIDYGILEKAKNVAAVAALGIEWSDLGSWESLTEVLPKNQDGNMFRGDVVSVDSTNTLVWGHKRVIASVGLNNMIIIDTPDAILVCQKNCSQSVKEVVAHLQKYNRAET